MKKYELEYNEQMYLVKFRHVRMPVCVDNPDLGVLSNGGKTIASIKLSETEFITAEANCSVKDAYNRRLGRFISLGRLRKKLNEDKNGTTNT